MNFRWTMEKKVMNQWSTGGNMLCQVTVIDKKLRERTKNQKSTLSRVRTIPCTKEGRGGLKMRWEEDRIKNTFEDIDIRVRPEARIELTQLRTQDLI